MQRAFEVDYVWTALALFVVPTLVGAIVEPPLLVLADRGRRKPLVCGGLFVMGLASVAAGLSPSFLLFALALCVWWVANGLSVSVAQALVVDEQPDSPETPMLRWVFWGTLGDLAAPALCAGLAAIGWGWRGAFVAAGLGVIVYALLLTTRPFPGEAPDEEDEDESTPPIRTVLWRALKNRRLLAWLAGTWTCDMLDELFVVFGSLHLRDSLGADIATRSMVLSVDVFGGLVGLALARRALERLRPTRVLAVSAACCLLAYVAWLLAPTVAASAALAFLLGAATAPLYPIALAGAFRALPGEPGAVQATQVLFTPLDLALPLLLGLLADAFGPLAALAVLALQPVALLLLGLFGAPADEPPSDERERAEPP